MELRLKVIYKNYRVQLVTEKDVYFSSGYDLFRSDNFRESLNFYAKFEYPTMNLFEKNKLLSRCFRGGFHSLINVGDTLVGVVPKHIVKIYKNEAKVTFDFKRGTRPLSICRTPDNFLYFGEYFNNQDRDEVYIYSSEDNGENWNVVYAFSKGSIRHIHNIIYDPFRKGILVLTGDEGKECKVLFTSDRFCTVNELISGNQNARAVTVIPTENGIIVPTDTPLEQNYIQFLNMNGKLVKLKEIPGSCFYSCKVGTHFFISTGIEPSKVNKIRFATLWSSSDGYDWKKVFEAKKDIWDKKVFQYGNIILPSGTNNSNYLYVTGVAVQKIDRVTMCWEVL